MVGPPHRWLNHREPLGLSSEQQILEEPADRFDWMANLDFEHPQVGRRADRHCRQGSIVVRAVRELREPMPSEFHVENPSEVRRRLEREVVEFMPVDIHWSRTTRNICFTS